MQKKTRKRKIFFLLFIVAVAYVYYKKTAPIAPASPAISFSESPKLVTINDNGLVFALNSKARDISGLLSEANIKLAPDDLVIPDISSHIFQGSNIEIKRSVKIKIAVDGKTIQSTSIKSTIAEVLSENNIQLGRLDKVFPTIHAVPVDNEEIVVTRINVEEKVIPEDIDFKTTAKEDKKLGWREKKVEIKGEKGVREIKYKITYKNGKEISRVVLEKNITKDPVTEVVVQGTYIKTGNVQKGQGTWYAWKGGLFAASTTIPRGGYARVTNTANGKSVIVQINDYGPQGKGRVIDLDKVAFAKIASLGAGVIGVKVEEVLN